MADDHEKRVAPSVYGRGLRAATAAAFMSLLLVLALWASNPGRAVAAAATAAQSSGSAEQLGANTGTLFNSGAFTFGQEASQLAALAQTGATLVRSDALWGAVEPDPPIAFLHRYNWNFDDLVAGSLAAQGLRWLPIIDYAAPWDRAAPGREHSPPRSPGDYAAYAAAFASRYGPGGLFWLEHPELKPLPVETYEIWNEPDNPQFWQPAPNPAAYGSLYLAARGAIISVQPGAQVLIGGLMRPGPFLSAMLAAHHGMQAEIDGVAIHPYGATPRRVFTAVRNARIAMRSHGLGDVPLYITEFGWTTKPPHALGWAPKRLRPRYISRTLARLGHTDCGIAAVLLYAWVTRERIRTDPQDWFGIAPPGGGQSADTAAFASGLRAAAAPAKTSPLCAPRKHRRHSHHH